MTTLVELLIALVLTLTGIDRTIDPALTAIAAERVQEIQSDFSHSRQRAGTAEVLAWNQGYPTGEAATRRAAQQWRESPVHWAILVDTGLTGLGCAISNGSDGTWWFACVLNRQAAPPPDPALPSAPAPSSVSPNVTVGVTSALPDTALPKGPTSPLR